MLTYVNNDKITM